MCECTLAIHGQKSKMTRANWNSNGKTSTVNPTCMLF